MRKFCAAPFRNFHLIPNGDIKPCCTWKGEIFGNVNENSIEEIFNNDKFKDLRRQFVENKRPDGCQVCWKREEKGLGSPRGWYDTHIDLNEHMSIDFTFDYWDIRNTNLCNQRCKTCGPTYSSMWNDNKEIIPNDGAMKQVYDMIDANIHNVKRVYFAGGEPLINPMHKYIVQKLLQEGRTDCILNYNTNMSILEYKGFNVFDAWKQFDQVEIGASIDGVGELNEYIRENSNWKKTLDNLLRVKEQSNIRLTITPVISSLNFHHMTDFAQFFLDQGFNQHQIKFHNVLLFPMSLRHKRDYKVLAPMMRWLGNNKDTYPVLYEDIKRILTWNDKESA